MVGSDFYRIVFKHQTLLAYKRDMSLEDAIEISVKDMEPVGSPSDTVIPPLGELTKDTNLDDPYGLIFSVNMGYGVLAEAKGANAFVVGGHDDFIRSGKFLLQFYRVSSLD